MRTSRVMKSIVLSTLASAASVAAGAPTEISSIVIYTVDSDTFELVRYTFATNSSEVIGKIRTESGTVLRDLEALAYIPKGPAKGFYAVPTRPPFERQLARIDPKNAIATVFAPEVVPKGKKITGMTNEYDAVTKRWFVLAARGEDKTSGRDTIEPRALIRIDPMTGVGTIAATEAQLGDGRRFEGLGHDSKGNIYAVGRTHFYRIHQEAGYSVNDLGSTGLDKSETFEVAFGDDEPSIDVPGINPAWTANGVFFVADEQLQKFGVLNPANGAFAEYLVDGAPSTVLTKDPEGMVILTFNQDPRFGMFDGFD